MFAVEENVCLGLNPVMVVVDFLSDPTLSKRSSTVAGTVSANQLKENGRGAPPSLFPYLFLLVFFFGPSNVSTSSSTTHSTELMLTPLSERANAPVEKPFPPPLSHDFSHILPGGSSYYHHLCCALEPSTTSGDHRDASSAAHSPEKKQ